MFFCFLFLILAEELVEGVTDPVEFGKFAIIVCRSVFFRQLELDLLGFFVWCGGGELGTEESIKGICQAFDLFNSSTLDFPKMQDRSVRGRDLGLVQAQEEGSYQIRKGVNRSDAIPEFARKELGQITVFRQIRFLKFIESTAENPAI